MARFETEFAAIHRCKFGLMCNSGTSALQIALAALKEVYHWHDGDEVLVPAVTFIASSNVVLYNDLKPVFVDVNPQDYNINPSKIEEKITPRTRAIMPVHVAGRPCDMDPILDIAQRHRLCVVEDSCESMFAKYKGRTVGSFGAIGCFSSYVAHMITSGVGGICTTNDPELFVLLKSLMNHGRDSIYVRMDDDRNAQGDHLFRIVNSRFSFIRLGYSFRATEMEAAVGLAQLEEHDSVCAHRRHIVTQLNAGLFNLQEHLQLPLPHPDYDHVYMFYPLTIINAEVQRDNLIRYLEDRGIETRYLLPLLSQPIYKKLFGDLEKHYPVAAKLNEAAFYIGCHTEMNDDDLHYIVECFQQYFGGLR